MPRTTQQAKNLRLADEGEYEYETMPVAVVVTRESFLGEGLMGQRVMPGERLVINAVKDVNGKPILGPNVRAATEADDAPRELIPIAEIGPSGQNPTVPQGLPAGAIQAGNKWLVPLNDGTGNYGELVPSTAETDPLLAAAQAAGQEQSHASAVAARSAPEGEDPLDGMKAAELRAFILDNGGSTQPANAKLDELKEVAKGLRK